MMRFQKERLLFLYDTRGAMREQPTASHFVRVCAGRITPGRPMLSPGGDCINPGNAFLTLSDVTKW